jgi:hypothetical protein
MTATHSPSQAPPAPTGPQPRLRLSLLSRPRSAHDELPQGTLAPSTTSSFHLHPKRARLAHTHTRQRLYLIPGEHWLCLASDDQTIFSCWSPHDIAAGIATTAALCSPNLPRGTIELAGLLPDGVPRVSIERPHMPNITIPVHTNVFLANLPADEPLPLQVHWQTHGHNETRPSGIPPGTTTDNCNTPPTPPHQTPQ